MKKLISVILLVTILLSVGASSASACWGSYCSNCWAEVSSDSRYCWSCGSRVNGGSSYNRTQYYSMVVYVTQEAAEPHYRVFRSFSINGEYDAYGARKSYGEKCLTVTVSAEQLAQATVYGAGEYIPAAGSDYVNGYNGTWENAYVMPIPLDSQGRCYPLFFA